MKQRQGVYTYRRGDRVDCIDRSTKAGLEQTEAAEAVVYGNLYCKMDKGAAKQGRKYLILFERTERVQALSSSVDRQSLADRRGARTHAVAVHS